MTRPTSPWRYLGLAFVVLGVGVLAVLAVQAIPRPAEVPGAAPTAAPAPSSPSSPPVATAALYVDPRGSDTDDGTAAAPLATIQAALDKATPGTVINLAPGVYRETLATVRDGAPGAPITIKGPESGKDRAGRYRAVVFGTGRVVSVNHSYYTFAGFTIDGQEKLAGTAYPTDLAAVTAFKNRVQPQVADGRLIYIGAADDTRDLTGITIHNMFLNGAGGECVRLRNNAHDNAITDSVIQYCGMFGKGDDDERAKYHNGEGVYIGTSPNSDSQPMHANDGSSRNLVARNTIRTFGSECFNVKENAHDNVLEDNVCSDNTEFAEFDGSNIELRGHSNVVRNNEISDSAGVNIKIRSDSKKFDRGGNVVENNRISGGAAVFMLDSAVPQGRMCGNRVTTQTLTLDDDGEPVGDITAPC
ncbi:right-handed parallel beta-helix repeat-containing protein [Pseudonocardia charpentierae]|uniref:Right-handed parallel beta-helix repeat-containing protein n=1 Tax=Pseudonocardia charpentierae TaxID=3075545 RepID=A0ABU2NGE8_9PSEU|nr:right-handed parallel beta-helix repeat-containing protein [Pseudonocardia sp. DSM 45834]MDT0352543.1 right-handed parallel beta-helix repeat-containing protein [Pseudonocardia sp. DSM 45834]